MSKQRYPQTATASSPEGEVRKSRSRYSHAKGNIRKNTRREEAGERQSYYDSLTTNAKLAKAKSRRGESKREVARLTKGLEWDKAQKVTAAARREQVASGLVQKNNT